MAELKELVDEILDLTASLREVRVTNTSNNSAANVHMHNGGMTRVEWATIVAGSVIMIFSACSVWVMFTNTEAQRAIYAEQRISDEKSMAAMQRENDILSRRIDVIEPQLRTLNLAKDAAIGRLNSIEGARK